MGTVNLSGKNKTTTTVEIKIWSKLQILVSRVGSGQVPTQVPGKQPIIKYGKELKKKTHN